MSIVLLYLLQRLQPLLPLAFGRGTTVDDVDTESPAMAFDNAVSFVTNTNWQSHVPEQVLGYTVQMAGLTVQNVLSAAVGIAVSCVSLAAWRRRRRAPRGDDAIDANTRA